MWKPGEGPSRLAPGVAQARDALIVRLLRANPTMTNIGLSKACERYGYNLNTKIAAETRSALRSGDLKPTQGGGMDEDEKGTVPEAAPPVSEVLELLEEVRQDREAAGTPGTPGKARGWDSPTPSLRDLLEELKMRLTVLGYHEVRMVWHSDTDKLTFRFVRREIGEEVL